MHTLDTEGFQIVRQLLDTGEVQKYQTEAATVAEAEKAVCVRNLQKKSLLFKNLAHSEKLKQLLPADYLPVRSILFDKTPEMNWPVAWHQDLTIAVKEQSEVKGFGPWSIKDNVIHVQPPVDLLEKMITIRIHLDDTPSTNGALKVIPKSSSVGKISHSQIEQYTNGNETTCECEAGDALLMSPLILHSSSRSVTPKARRILHFEYAPINGLPKELSWVESSDS